MNIITKMSPLERKVFPLLVKTTSFNELVKLSGLKPIEVTRALQWLSNKGLVNLSYLVSEQVVSGPNLIKAKKTEFPELRILKLLREKPMTINMISKELGMSPAEVGGVLGVLKSKRMVMITKSAGETKLKFNEQEGKSKDWEKYVDNVQSFKRNNFPLNLSNLTDKQKVIFQMLKKRKGYVDLVKVKRIIVKVPNTTKVLLKKKMDFSNVIENLTPEMIANGSWKNKVFREYDIVSNVPTKTGGRRHPLSESVNLIRDVFIQMGFQEMDGPWVETEFWCMDSMWIPQDHPSRDVQDTFFVKGKGKLPNKKLVNAVKQVQETGGDTGSTGHGYVWDPEKAAKLILRTHSTSATFRKFGNGLNKDCKYFYIANNFRNETTDATHLTEFLQAEGFIMGDDLSLSDLMGFIKEFYAKLGITKIRFKPTYNPYTEPSMEAHYYDEKKGKWYALINSGIFRPESLAPFGITKSVIAWGMGASRIATILTGKNNLREMVGATTDIDWIRNHKYLKRKI